VPSSDDTHRSTPLQDRAEQNVRALVERNRQDPGYDGPPVEPRRFDSVGVLGAGLMGTSIAAAHLRHGIRVVVHDSDADSLGIAPQRVAADLGADMPTEQARRLVERLLHIAPDEAEAAACDLVVESIVEAFVPKRDLLRRLRPALRGEAVVVSNTSTIPIGRLAAEAADPGRFCGMHFCHPVRLRPLVEVVRGAKTTDATAASIVAHAKAIGKMPVVAADGPGFLVNRLLLPYLGEALELLLEGAGVEAVEQAAAEFGFAKGPLRLLDEIGLDTTLHAGWVLAEAFPERIVASPLLVSMVKAGKLGKKSGAGFFSYANGPDAELPQRDRDEVGPRVPPPPGERRRPIDPLVPELIAKWAKPGQNHTPHSIVMRLLLPMVLEATRLLGENKARDARDIDLAVVFGLGFPQSRGGLLWWADTLGAARLVEMLRPLERLGPRTRPTPELLAMARSHRRFYETPGGRAPGR
jgi:3-hydroxyacyl-CoA dehydrogenase